jgi:hypothetical protein
MRNRSTSSSSIGSTATAADTATVAHLGHQRNMLESLQEVGKGLHLSRDAKMLLGEEYTSYATYNRLNIFRGSICRTHTSLKVLLSAFV